MNPCKHLNIQTIALNNFLPTVQPQNSLKPKYHFKVHFSLYMLPTKLAGIFPFSYMNYW